MTRTASRPERSATGAYARRPSRRTSTSQLARISAATVAGSEYTSSGWGEAPLVLLNEEVPSLHAAAIPSLFRTRPPAAEVGVAFRAMVEDPATVWLIAEDEKPCGFLYAQFH